MTIDTVLDKLEYFKILDWISKYTSTESGRKIILNTRPSADINEISKKGNYVSEAKEVLIENTDIPLSYIPDLFEVFARSRVEGGIINQSQILEILKLAETSRKVYQFLKSRENDYGLINDYTGNFFIDKVFEKHLREVFTESGEISDKASSKLGEIRKDIASKGDQLRKVVNRLLKQLSEAYLVQEEYMTQRDGRIVLPIKAEHKRHVRGFIHSESATGQTVYIEPEETLELNNEILSLSFAEKREIERILKNLTKKIGEVSYELEASLRAIAELDAVFAKARHSLEIIGSFPEFDENKKIEILDARHPLLLKKTGREQTVPLDLVIDKDKVIIITGPNAGGKTVVLKTVGLNVLLAHSGIHIPASADSNLHLMTKVLIDIGDEQSIEDDLSTFSSHLSNILGILNSSDEKSLVLLDEIGTGTDPAEGSALASALLIKLKEKGATVLATTHHGNIKLFANDLDGFQNASMEFDSENLAPTYKFNQGLPGSSYAFEVAARIGYDADILDLAKHHLDTDKTKIEEFLVELENRSNDLKRKLDQMEIENTRLKGLANLYKEKVDKLEKQKKEILSDTRQRAESYLKEMNKRFESSIKKIKETNAERSTIKEEKEKIKEIKQEAEEFFPEKEEIPAQTGELKVGDFVAIKNTSAKGVLTEINKSKNKAYITSGSIKLQAKYSDLVLAKPDKEQRSDIYRESYTPDIPGIQLDIRGQKPEEAEFEIIKFLDDSYMANMGNVEILHGKGTGILKRTVHDILEKHEKVKDFYYAKIEFGGEGITIVEFK